MSESTDGRINRSTIIEFEEAVECQTQSMRYASEIVSWLEDGLHELRVQRSDFRSPDFEFDCYKEIE